MNRLFLAFQWFFSILFGKGLARLRALEEAAVASPARPEPRPEAAPRPAPVEPAPVVAPKATAALDASAAMRLLALLQGEARLVDFVMEDIDGYTDEQVGAGVRAVHSGCRRLFKERIALEPILPEPEGSAVQVPAGFDPAAIRLVGSVSGQPPFYGTLQHHGWRVVSLSLPELKGATDARIVAPAEVEV